MRAGRICIAPIFVASVASVAFVASVAAGCSASPSSGGGDHGVAVPVDPATAGAPDKNPEGVAYPTENLGTNPRLGPHPGNRIANYKFLGYPGGDVSKGLQPISLAMFFDPTGARYRLIHIQASGSWCVNCQEETKVVTTLKDKLAERKVAWLISLSEGASPGTAATTTDLDHWIAQLKAPFTHVLDPGNRNFGTFYDASVLPWNAIIDARTMEILTSGIGAQTRETTILGDLDGWLAKTSGDAVK